MRTHPRLILQTETAAETKVSAAGSSVLRVADDVTDWRSAALHCNKETELRVEIRARSKQCLPMDSSTMLTRETRSHTA